MASSSRSAPTSASSSARCPGSIPQAGSSPGDTAFLPTPYGPVLVYDPDGGFRYVSAPDVTLDDLLDFAKTHGG